MYAPLCRDRSRAAHVMAKAVLVAFCLALAGAVTCQAAASESRLVMKPLDMRAARGQADGFHLDASGARPEQFSGYFQVCRRTTYHAALLRYLVSARRCCGQHAC